MSDLDLESNMDREGGLSNNLKIAPDPNQNIPEQKLDPESPTKEEDVILGTQGGVQEEASSLGVSEKNINQEEGSINQAEKDIDQEISDNYANKTDIYKEPHVRDDGEPPRLHDTAEEIIKEATGEKSEKGVSDLEKKTGEEFLDSEEYLEPGEEFLDSEEPLEENSYNSYSEDTTNFDDTISAEIENRAISPLGIIDDILEKTSREKEINNMSRDQLLEEIIYEENKEEIKASTDEGYITEDNKDKGTEDVNNLNTGEIYNTEINKEDEESRIGEIGEGDGDEKSDEEYKEEEEEAGKYKDRDREKYEDGEEEDEYEDGDDFFIPAIAPDPDPAPSYTEMPPGGFMGSSFQPQARSSLAKTEPRPARETPKEPPADDRFSQIEVTAQTEVTEQPPLAHKEIDKSVDTPLQDGVIHSETPSEASSETHPEADLDKDSAHDKDSEYTEDTQGIAKENLSEEEPPTHKISSRSVEQPVPVEYEHLPDWPPRIVPRGNTRIIPMQNRYSKGECPLCVISGPPVNTQDPKFLEKAHEYAYRLWAEWDPADQSKAWIGRVQAVCRDLGFRVDPKTIQDHYARHKIEQPAMPGSLNHKLYLEQAMELSPLQRKIIHALHRQKVLTTQQINALLFSDRPSEEASRKAIKKELWPLAQSHFAYKYHPSKEDGRMPGALPYLTNGTLWYTGRRALPYIMNQYGLSFQPPHINAVSQVKKETLMHDISANEIFVSLTRALNKKGGNIPTTYGNILLESDLENWYGPGPKLLSMGFHNRVNNEYMIIRPDGFATLSLYSGGGFDSTILPFWIEYDRGSKDREDVARQMLAYHFLGISGAAGRRFPDLAIENYAVPLLMVFRREDSLRLARKRFLKITREMGISRGVPIFMALEEKWNKNPLGGGICFSAWNEDDRAGAFIEMLLRANEPLYSQKTIPAGTVLELDANAAVPKIEGSGFQKERGNWRDRAWRQDIDSRKKAVAEKIQMRAEAQQAPEIEQGLSHSSAEAPPSNTPEPKKSTVETSIINTPDSEKDNNQAEPPEIAPPQEKPTPAKTELAARKESSALDVMAELLDQGGAPEPAPTPEPMPTHKVLDASDPWRSEKSAPNQDAIPEQTAPKEPTKPSTDPLDPFSENKEGVDIEVLRLKAEIEELRAQVNAAQSENISQAKETAPAEPTQETTHQVQKQAPLADDPAQQLNHELNQERKTQEAAPLYNENSAVNNISREASTQEQKFYPEQPPEENLSNTAIPQQSQESSYIPAYQEISGERDRGAADFPDLESQLNQGGLVNDADSAKKYNSFNENQATTHPYAPPEQSSHTQEPHPHAPPKEINNEK